MLRLVRCDDLERLREIERAAGAAFRDIGMQLIADDEPMDIKTLAGYQENARAWVACVTSDIPIGYIIVDEIDDAAHIEQVSVDPSQARNRLGSALIDEVEKWAVMRGLVRLTLTTFESVPWNAPYYERLGFHVLPSAQWTASIREIVASEAAQGLHRWPRTVMTRPLKSPTALHP
jgi:GNAT superfamily N-acetyltransferase